VKRISCIDLALGYACDRVIEAETDEALLELALAHARDEHGEPAADAERWRPLVSSAR
jgi:predicted small metal-binding protein